MRKLILILISVLFALSLMACDGFTPPEVAATQGSDDFLWDDGLGPLQPGEFFVGVSKSQARALTPALARAGADFFEVVFTDGTLFERAAFSEGRVVRMRAPVLDVDYNNAGIYKAFVFAGNNESKMLLGIGMIDEVVGATNTTNSNNLIYSDSTRVNFKLEALTTDVKAATGSTFTITGNGVNVLNQPVVGAGYSVPVFLLPKSVATGLVASFKYKLTNTYSFSENLFDAILYTGTPTPVITTKETILQGYDTQLSAVTTNNITVNISGTDQTDAEVDVTFNIITPAKDGLGLLYIDIPVYLLDGPALSSPTAVTWRLRGGLENALIDVGAAHNSNDGSLGGSVLIGVGSVFTGAGFEVGKD